MQSVDQIDYISAGLHHINKINTRCKCANDTVQSLKRGSEFRFQEL